jgi:hypothetical protein
VGFAGTKVRGRPGSKDGEKQAIWVPILNNASKGKDLAEKQLIVLGETEAWLLFWWFDMGLIDTCL